MIKLYGLATKKTNQILYFVMKLRKKMKRLIANKARQQEACELASIYIVALEYCFNLIIDASTIHVLWH